MRLSKGSSDQKDSQRKAKRSGDTQPRSAEGGPFTLQTENQNEASIAKRALPKAATKEGEGAQQGWSLTC